LEIPKLINGGNLKHSNNIIFPISYPEALKIHQAFTPSKLYQGARNPNRLDPQVTEISQTPTTRLPESLDPLSTLVTHTNTWLHEAGGLDVEEFIDIVNPESTYSVSGASERGDGEAQVQALLRYLI